MRKGQAFDTFKLMIAAVVAVAILGILLAILGGISPPGADPASIIKEQLSTAYQYQKSVFLSNTKADFKKGVVYSEESFKSIIGGVGSIEFACATDLITAGACVDTTAGVLTIEKDFQAEISACYDGSDGYIGIGKGALTSC